METLEDFKRWLEILGYSERRTRQYPRAVERLLIWLKKYTIKEILSSDASNYILYMKSKSHQPSYINNQITAFKTFARYYHLSTKKVFPVSHLHYCKVLQKEPVVLTVEEIKQLYAVTTNSKYGYRDRAMLVICYGCGLRRGEAIQLLVTDLDLKHGFVHVRKTKNYKERIVPIPMKGVEDLKAFIKHGRPLLQKSKHYQRELFLGYRGSVVTSQVFEKRIKVLAKLTGNPELISKNITLHLLRHSIATHLLHAGVAIELVSKLLGHSSLTATQVYTHL